MPQTVTLPNGTKLTLNADGQSYSAPDGTVYSVDELKALGVSGLTSLTYSGAGLPPGYVQGSDGVVYRQTTVTDASGTHTELRPATGSELASLAQAGGAKTVDIGGELYQWNPQTNAYDINLGASGAGRAPASWSYQTDVNGDLYAFNPQDPTQKVLVQKGFAAPTLTPSQQASQTQAAQNAQNQFTAGQNALNRTATATNQANQQTFTANQNAIDRALTAADTAAKYGVQNQQLGLQGQAQAYSQAAQTQNDALSAANQFASLTNNVDLGALPAFLAAGGGNIYNAITGANPSNALTDAALLPAATTLRGIAEMSRPAPYTVQPVVYNPYQYSPSSFGAIPTQTTAVKQVIPTSLPTAQENLAGGIVPTAQNSSNFENRPTTPAETQAYDAAAFGNGGQFAAAPGFVKTALGVPGVSAAATPAAPAAAHVTGSSAQLTPEQLDAMVRAQSPAGSAGATPRMASGGIATGMAVVGDSHTGRPNEEIVMPFMMAGRPAIYVMPKPSNMDHMAHMADGGTVVGATPITVSAQDQPYVDQVRALRENTQVPGFSGIFGAPQQGSPVFNTQWGMMPSEVQQSYYDALQRKYGAPASTFADTAQRYALGGVSRTGFGAYHPWQFGM